MSPEAFIRDFNECTARIGLLLEWEATDQSLCDAPVRVHGPGDFIEICDHIAPFTPDDVQTVRYRDYAYYHNGEETVASYVVIHLRNDMFVRLGEFEYQDGASIRLKSKKKEYSGLVDISELCKAFEEISSDGGLIDTPDNCA